MRKDLNYSALIQNSYLIARDRTIELCAPLAYDDYLIQSSAYVSPPKWHLAHTTWFFETFVLQPFATNYRPLNPLYRKVFNSYYQTVDSPIQKENRFLLSRPTLEEIIEYREFVDSAIVDLLETSPTAETLQWLELGIEHEEQHQELLLMDIKDIFYRTPTQPNYSSPLISLRPSEYPALEFIALDGGLIEVGTSEDTFAFDNERPSHAALLSPYSLANRLTTNAEYLEFIEEGGYQKPELWLSDGWDKLKKENWIAPLYWEKEHGEWFHFTLRGMRTLLPAEPVSHLSYFEADAFARWKGARLPTEFEWENAAKLQRSQTPAEGNFLEDGQLHAEPPSESPGAAGFYQLFGDLWEWTASAYLPYPGYKKPAGVLGEYNSKFMANQMVLRGGSFATPRNHIRSTYRNFYAPDMRWQFSGLRLAKDLE